jgi:hypothetical protein
LFLLLLTFPGQIFGNWHFIYLLVQNISNLAEKHQEKTPTGKFPRGE